MARIKVLDEHIANQIAAGEVVERPASVVKELLENSIDAGSTRVEVSVEEGGLQSIRVTDNGGGIDPEDVETAFYRHATSKIVHGRDLFQITSLGFRGEALPSIAAVSKVELLTASGDDGKARRIVIEGGKLVTHEEAAAQQGTDFIVRELFYNTPARLKYMKTIQTELGHISDVLYRMALSHPEIAFTLRHNGNTLLRTLGNGDLLQVIAAVYGTAAAKAMIPLEDENLDYRLYGYVSRPEWTRSSRNAISTVVNGRYIRGYGLNQALLKAYHTLLPINRYPLTVLCLDMHPSLVDVNVHPAKLEVRFSKEPELYQFVEQAVRSALHREVLIPKAVKREIGSPTSRAFIQEQFRFGSAEQGASTLPDSSSASQQTSEAVKMEQAAASSQTHLVAEDEELDAPAPDVIAEATKQEEASNSIPEQASKTSGVHAGASSESALSKQLSGEPSQQLSTRTELQSEDTAHGGKSSPSMNQQDTGQSDKVYMAPAYSDKSDLTEQIAAQNAVKKPENREYASGIAGVKDSTTSKMASSTVVKNASVMPTAYSNGSIVRETSSRGAGSYQSGRGSSSNRASMSWTPEQLSSVAGSVPEIPAFPELSVIGQHHGTYLIAQNDSGLYLIDQHAAHERINYEYYYEKFGKPEQASQELLLPITLEFTPSESDKLKDRLSWFAQVGVHLEHFGGQTFRVTSYPYWLPKGEEQDVIEEMAEWVLDEKSIDLAKLREASSIMCSCKASIKANQKLTIQEADVLLKRLAACKQPYTCPHGRPIVISFSTYDLEKMFKRVM
ncbi:DNA mismatch repair endonuclease MutL [Paenibacillus massiliensis]|uniref:DNA mismatch repair endonuclease MutL n=1 Tax=Paenibacillus massiliensis TaxID=225917 RepID=UPI0004072BA7|nr:DNA mismatch repair endonuclease MutL [Paenibacillus massiliensis]